MFDGSFIFNLYSYSERGETGNNKKIVLDSPETEKIVGMNIKKYAASNYR